MVDESEKSIFLSALEFAAPEERATYIERVCGRNSRMKAAVNELLAAHERTDNILDATPEPGEFIRASHDSNSGANPAACTPNSNSPTAQITEGPGTIIGPYKLMEQIGEGGFGYVFVAEQQQPVRRKVALKVVKPGMDSKEVIARFEAERQALALMDHPNIARVFDAGTSDTGRPYFVMELVRGVSITQFCEECGSSIRQRLKLFITVCNAVQHAHQKGIIHRDLKPPNVMVTLHDGAPVVKIIDFGVAKAMHEPLTTKTIYTRFAQVIGTPLYMSPEQVELSGLDVDTRSDIYSLGVLLYEMLTGETPFDQERFGTISFDELRRIIREEEPPRPSVRLTTVRQRGITVPASREITSRAAFSAVKGDLDWIVMKALEKERTRRYDTATEFAADVRRFLFQEPIEARPPSPFYRFSKFARRNKVVLTTASLVMASLVLGTGVSIWQAVLADNARAEAESLKQEAVEFSENLKNTNILLDTARANTDSQRWAIAYEQYTRAIQLQPEHYPVWSGRAALLIRLGIWDRAAADYARALALGASANDPGWWGVPQLFLYAGNRIAYETASSRMFEQHRDSSDVLFKMVALRAMLVQPNPTIDSQELAQLSESLLLQARFRPFSPHPFSQMPMDLDDGPPKRNPVPPQRAPGPPRRPPRGQPGFRGRSGGGLPPELLYYTAGLAQYRAGQNDKAIQYLRESAVSNPRTRAQTAMHPVLAMALHRSGQTDEASSNLAKAQEIIDQWLVAVQDEPVGSQPILWFDFLEYLLLFNEANQLITGSPVSEDPRINELQQRALEALGLPQRLSI